MRRMLVTAVVAALALAGCSSSSKSFDCPPYFPEGSETQMQQAKDAYDDAREQAGQQGAQMGEWPDADMDCIPDAAETALGSDPNDQGSYPTEAQIVAAAQNGTLPGMPGGPQPAEPQYTWERDTASGQFTTTAAVSPGGQGGFDVPSGSVRLLANFTVAGTLPGEVSIRLNPPSCAGNPQCTAIPQQTTQGGAVSFDVADPEEGAYTLGFFAANGAQTGTWRVELANYVPAVPASPVA